MTKTHMPTKASNHLHFLQRIFQRLIGMPTAATHGDAFTYRQKQAETKQPKDFGLNATSQLHTFPWTTEKEEVAWSEGAFFQQQPGVPWYSEAGGGWSIGIYRRVMKDDQIRALLGLKQAVITSRSWRFEGTTPRQQLAAEFFHTMLEKHLCGSFHQAMGQMLTSHVFGFSLLEKIYQSVVWQGQPRWSLRALKLRPAETFRFVCDRNGNTVRLTQQQGASQVDLPLERFIHYVNKPEEHAQYGESDLRECYRHWWAKENIFKFWNIYLERMASGFVHGRISGPISRQDRESLKQAMQSLGGRTSIITPANVELEMVNAPSTDAFERAIAARDKAMAKALLVPNLLGFSEQGNVGGYSQSRTQLETFFFVLNGIAESIADTLNEQLFRELAWWNFGLKEAPRFSFAPLTEQQRQDIVSSWKNAVASGLVRPSTKDELRIRELLGFPPPADNNPPESSIRPQDSNETKNQAGQATLPNANGSNPDIAMA